MKTKFAKGLKASIKENIKSMKEFGYSYNDIMKRDSTEEFVGGCLMIEKILVISGMKALSKDITELKEKYIKSNKADFAKLIKERCNPKDYGFKNEKEMLELYDVEGTTENISWEQGYISGLRDAFNAVNDILKQDQEELYKFLPY